MPSSLQLSREETIKQVTATFPAKNYSKDFRLSDVSFVCTDKENDGRKSNAVFNIQPSKQTAVETTERASDIVVNKKLDFNRLSNPKFSLIAREGRNNIMQNYHPLTQRNEASTSSKCEAASSKLDESNPENKMMVLESLK